MNHTLDLAGKAWSLIDPIRGLRRELGRGDDRVRTTAWDDVGGRTKAGPASPVPPFWALSDSCGLN